MQEIKWHELFFLIELPFDNFVLSMPTSQINLRLSSRGKNENISFLKKKSIFSFWFHLQGKSELLFLIVPSS